jgi:hypothetical protein
VNARDLQDDLHAAAVAARVRVAPSGELEEALAVRIPNGRLAGLTVAELMDEDGAQEWVRWALRLPARWPEPFRAALELVARTLLPEIWDRATGDEGREAA